MNALLIGLVLDSMPVGPLSDSVDMVELNHCRYSETSSFDQLIWWDDVDGEYRIRDWRMAERAALPLYDRRRRRWVSRWRDSSSGNALREVEAASRRETWTSHDPELEDRNACPVDYRRRLTEPRR